MLINSNRITDKDYLLWKEYEEIDAINSISKNLEKKEELAIKEICNFSKESCYVGVSWGKDSIVVSDLITKYGLNIPIVHLYCIPSHNLECDKVRDAYIFKYKNIHYVEIKVNYENIYSKGLCDIDQDKLTDIEWYKAFKKVGSLFGNRHISGIRKQESGIRKIRMNRWGLTTKNTCAPIGYWSTLDVFAYLYKYNLPIHPNYAMLGGGRWKREYIRVAEIGDIHGTEIGRREWEQEYYSDILAYIQTYKRK